MLQMFGEQIGIFTTECVNWQSELLKNAVTSWPTFPWLFFSVKQPALVEGLGATCGSPSCVCASDSDQFVKAAPSICGRVAALLWSAKLYGFSACLRHRRLGSLYSRPCSRVSYVQAFYVSMVYADGMSFHRLPPTWHAYFRVLGCLCEWKDTKERPFCF